MQAAGFTDCRVVEKPSSRSFIKEWLPGSGAEDFVVSANVTATKPGGVAGGEAGGVARPTKGCCEPGAPVASTPAAAAWAESEEEQMPARMRAKLEQQAKSKQCCAPSAPAPCPPEQPKSEPCCPPQARG
mmetsp:Transcript_10819/g.26954  ORF Transcript_10819/g.26954 Transcript_10819/m.26954 type:complete len:130 (-) Transcript_10819:117-506(-)